MRIDDYLPGQQNDRLGSSKRQLETGKAPGRYGNIVG
jgi:hypothetical protein